MSITNYSELQTALTNWSHRADLASVHPDFIVMAEARFNRRLRTRNMEAITAITPSSGVCTLPSDFLEARRVYIDTDSKVELEYLPPEQFYIKFPTAPTNFVNTKSKYYTIQGSSLYLSDKNNTTDISLLYYQKIPALTNSNTSNWVLSSHPDLYLAASLVQLYKYVKKPTDMALWDADTETLLAALDTSDKKGKYSGSAMRVISA